MARKSNTAPVAVVDDTEVKDTNPEAVGSDVVEPETVSPGEPVVETSKSAVELRADADAKKAVYDDLAQQVPQAVKASHALERELMAEVKRKLIEHAGDVDALKAKKREAFMAYEAANKAATDAEQRETVT